MAKIPNLDYAPPKSWEDFESMMLELYQKKWHDPKAQKNGRKGQKQQGTDVWGHNNGSKAYSGIQCKGKERWPPQKLTFTQVKAEVAKAEGFEPHLADYEIATTAKRDAALDTKIRKFNETQLKNGKLQVSVKYWEDILEDEAFDISIARKYLGTQYESSDILANAREVNMSQRISDARKLMDEHKANTALAQLQAIRADEWLGLTDNLKFKVLSNLGVGYANRHEFEKAADHFIEAYNLLPGEENAVTNRAWAHIQRAEYAEARKLLEPFIKEHPSNERGYSNYINASDDKNLAQLLAIIPRHAHEISGVASALANVAHIEGKLDEAEKLYEQAIKTAPDEGHAIESKLGLAAVLNSKAYSIKDILGLRQINQTSQGLINKSVQLVADWWHVIGNTELARYNTDQAVRLAHQLRMSGGIGDAKKIAYQVLGIDPENTGANLLLGLIASDKGELDDAASFFEVVANKDDIDAQMLLIQTKSRQGKSQEVIEGLLKLKPRLTDNEQQRQAMDILSGEYIRTQQYEAATKEIDDFLKLYPNDMSALIQRAAIILLTEGEEKAINELKDVVKNCTTTNRDELLELADALYGARLYQEAADIYQRILDATVVTDWVKRLLDCYYHLGRYKEALKIAADLRDKNGPIPFVTELESYIYDAIGDLPKAKEACEELLRHFPDNKGIKLRLALTDFKLNDLKAADTLLDEFSGGLGLSVSDTVALVGLMYERGFKDKARALLYKLRRDNPGDKEVHSKYIAFFFMMDRDAEEFEVTEIGNDTAVSVEGSFGQTTYLIHDGLTNYESKEFNINDPVAKALQGKKVGDELDLSPGTDRVKITDIKSKYIYALLKSQELFQSAIFQTKDLKRFTFDPTRPEEAVKEINKNVTERRRAVETIEKLYQDKKVTLGGFANLIGKTTYEIFKELENRELTSTIYVSNGKAADLDTAASLEIEAQLIVDETSLITIQELGIDDLVVKHYGKLGIARATLDSLQEHARRMGEVRKEGFKTLTSANGKIIVDDITPETVENYLDNLNKLLDFIDKNCEVLSVDKALDIESSRLDELKRTLGESSTMAILLAAEGGRVLFSEDGLLRDLANYEYTIPSIWTQPVLLQLKAKGALDQGKLNELLIELIKRNHCHTNFDLSTLELAAANSDWRLDGDLKTVIRVFAEPGLEQISTVGIATNFLYLAWKHKTLNLRNRELIARNIISNLSKRPDKSQVLATLVAAINLKFKLWPSAAEDIKNIVNQFNI